MYYNNLFITNHIPDLLSKNELYDCFNKYKTGDLEARNKIIEHNIKLVSIVVNRRFFLAPYEKQELMGVGLEALIKSVDTFDINKGFEFSTYASKVINNEIYLFMKKNKKYIYDESFEQSIIINNDEDEVDLNQVLKNDNSDFVSDYEKKEIYMIIRELINNLPDREKKIILMYFGFIDDKVYSQSEIANQVGIVQSSVSRIIVRVMNELKKQLMEMDIIDYNEKTKRK